MIYNIRSYLDNILVVFALIGAIYGAYKVLKKPLMNFIKRLTGISELETHHAIISKTLADVTDKLAAIPKLQDNQNEMAKTLSFLSEKVTQIHNQLTINGGAVTIKDDLGAIKDSLNVIRAEQMATIELSSIPTFINNGKGECIFVNDALCKLFGAKQKEEMLNYSWTNFLDDDEKQKKAEYYSHSIKINDVVRDHYHINNPITKTRCHAEYSATVTRDRNGAVKSVMGTFRILE